MFGLRTRKPREGIETEVGRSDHERMFSLRTRKPREGIETCLRSRVTLRLVWSQN